VETNANGTIGIGFTQIPIVYGTNTTTIVTNSDGSTTVTMLVSQPMSYNFTNYVLAAIPENPKNVNQPWDYLPASGILTFNDFEMTKDIYVTLSTNNYFVETPVNVTVTLDSATLDPSELQTIPAPTLELKPSGRILISSLDYVPEFKVTK